MKQDAKQIISTAMSQPWPWRGLQTHPVLATILLYTAGVAAYGLTSAGIPTWTIPTTALACGVIAVMRAMSLHVIRLGLAYITAVTLWICAWLTYAAQTLTFDARDWTATRTHLLICAAPALILTIVHARLVIHRRRNPRHALEATAYQAPALDTGETLHDEGTGALDEPTIVTHLKALGLTKGYRYSHADETPDATTYHLNLTGDGVHVTHFANKARDLEIRLRSPYEGAVTVYKGAHVGRISIRAAKVDALATERSYPLDHTPLTVHGPITPGRKEDGTPRTLPVAAHTGLVFGQRGGGKSTFLLVLIAEYLRMNDALVIVIDPKGGPLIAPWLAPYALGQVTRPALMACASTPDEVKAIARFLDDLGHRREKRLVMTDKVHTSPTQPHILVVVDELDEVTGSTSDPETSVILKRVVRKHRAAGIDLAALASQRATGNMTGGRDLTTQAGWVALFNVADKAETWTAMNVAGVSVDASRFVHPGTMLCKVNGEGIDQMAARGDYLDYADMPGHALRTDANRPEPDTDISSLLTRHGIDTWWDNPNTTAGRILEALRTGEMRDDHTPMPEPVPVLLDAIAEIMETAQVTKMPTADIITALSADFGVHVDGERPAERGFALKRMLWESLSAWEITPPTSCDVGGPGTKNLKGYKLADVHAAINAFKAATDPATRHTDPATPDSDVADHVAA